MITFLPYLKLSYKRSYACASHLYGGSFFSLSRHVIKAIIESHGWSFGDQVVMPGSICGEAIKPFLAAEMSIDCYAIDRGLTSDMTSIRNSISDRTVAVYLVHYFGRKDSNAEKIRALCNELKILLIEDCALCFPINIASGIGSFGDYSFFSLWKYFAVPDGSVVFSRGRANGLAQPMHKPDVARVTKRLIGMMLPNGLHKFRGRKAQLAHQDDSRRETSLDIGTPSSPERISLFSKSVVYRSDFISLAQARRKNYEFIKAQLVDHRNISPLWPESCKEYVPYAFPLVTDSPIALQQFLLDRGVQSEIAINYYSPFAGRVGGDMQDMEVINELANTVICVPVHQYLSEKDLFKITESLNAYE